MKLWQKQYKLNKAVEKFTVGNDYILDRRLVKYDCLASIAHAKMLVKIGVLKPEEAKAGSPVKEIIAFWILRVNSKFCRKMKIVIRQLKII